MINTFESGEAESQPKPDLQDIVKINGRWAQVFGGGDVVKYLDDASLETVDWDNYRLLRRIDKDVLTAELVLDIKLTDKQKKAIYWGAEQEKDQKLNLNTKIFGEFEKIH